jgi:hypothetical protein
MAVSVDSQTPSARGFLLWARQDSNLGPTDYESAALTAELRARGFVSVAERPSQADLRVSRVIGGQARYISETRSEAAKYPTVPAAATTRR